MYDNGRVEESFVTSSSTTMDDSMWQYFADMPMQSWDYYYTAADAEEPLYCVELAKSGRSGCKQRGAAKKCEDPSIGRGEIRVGSMDELSGAYGRWNHLACWRVPSKMWMGLPDPEECDDPEQFEKALVSMNEVLLCGFSALPRENKAAMIEHVMDKENWAKKVTRREKNDAAIVPVAASSEAGNGKELVREGYHVAREHFVPPVPGKDGVAGALEGKTVVLTGIFPEVGGGKGLNLGKAKVKAMVELFGGRVTGSVSGRTDILIIGKDPGWSKVTQAEASAKCKLISLKDLKDVVEGGCLEDAASKPLFIPAFSAGYPGAKAIKASSEPMAFVVNADSDADKKPAAKRKRSNDDSDNKPAATKRQRPTRDGGKKPVAKKASKSKAIKAKSANEKENVDIDLYNRSNDDGEMEPAAKRERSNRGGGKKPAAKKAKKAKPATDEEENVTCEEQSIDNDRFDVFCDLCDVDCTEKSWHVEATNQDFCAACHDGRGVPQCNGVNE